MFCYLPRGEANMRARRERHPENWLDPAMDADAPVRATPVPGRRPKRLKFKKTGYRIERSTNGHRWALEKYYRNEAAMRRAYASCAKRGSQKWSWHPYVYRMVFPDGRILPRAYDHRDFEYHYTLERLNPRSRSDRSTL
jgi:hypothetical protein